jgi:lysozyme family protein
MVSVHSSKSLTKTEVGTRDWGIAVTIFCLEEYGFWDFGFGKQWNALSGT